ncbi:MAG: glycosyltransferase [Pseudohongiellaceae bacterium]
MSGSLSISIVVYHLDSSVLKRLLTSLAQAVRTAQEAGCLNTATLTLVDNAEDDRNESTLAALLEEQAPTPWQATLETGHGNIGYGRGHNRVISEADSDFHLILNPDVFLAPDALAVALAHFGTHPHTVAVAPAITDGEGRREYACKRYPSVLDFLLRGFAPAFLRRRFSSRLARYEMQDLPDDRPTQDIPIISGCCMLFRSAALRELGGFDPRYFLYFEDFDLSMRAHPPGPLTYLPDMHITHLGGNSARKGLRHILLFARSGVRFFRDHGWRWW